jgi:hypothetical protein
VAVAVSRSGADRGTGQGRSRLQDRIRSGIPRRDRGRDEARAGLGVIEDETRESFTRPDGNRLAEEKAAGATGRGSRRPGRAAAAAARRGATYGSDTMLGIDKLYSLGAKGHNI